MKRCPNGTRRNKNTGLCDKKCPKGSRKVDGLCKKYKQLPKSPEESPPKSPAEFPPEEIFDLKVQSANVNNLAVNSKEVIIMVGYPASGKSTVSKELEKHNYIRIDGDALKTGPKMVKEAEKYINNNSVIFDATNGTKERRKYYLDFAKKHNVNVRCIWKTTPIEQAMEQNRERQKQGGPKIPDVVFYTYRKKFEEPTESECTVVKL
jgi:predicted kinase